MGIGMVGLGRRGANMAADATVAAGSLAGLVGKLQPPRGVLRDSGEGRVPDAFGNLLVAAVRHDCRAGGLSLRTPGGGHAVPVPSASAPQAREAPQ